MTPVQFTALLAAILLAGNRTAYATNHEAILEAEDIQAGVAARADARKRKGKHATHR